MRALALLALVVPPARGAIPSHEVRELPGWSRPLTSKVYSGYFTVEPSPPHTEDRHLHYVFVESESEPSTDPVQLWLNGGPGSSSLKGLFSQLGPYSLNDASYPAGDRNRSGPLQLFRNNATWNRFSNILYLEQPAGVGFSYCNESLHADSKDNCEHSDSSVAADNFALLKAFFADNAFGEFRKNELYLSGVSYAGVYVTTLAGLVLSDPAKTLHLNGVSLGNPSFRWGSKESGEYSNAPQSVESITKLRMDMLGSHGQFSPALYAKIRSTCRFFNNNTVVPALECEQLLAQMKEEVGGYDLYNIYDRCKLAGDDLTSERLSASVLFSPDPQIHPDDERFGSCGQEHALHDYCNQPAVRTALHVPSIEQIGEYYVSESASPDNWGTGGYTKNEFDTRQFYLQMINAGVRILIYSGDVDNCLPYTGSLQWVQLLGLNETEAWRPWTVDGGRRMGGYVVTFGGGQLQFVTVRGAGHMVPEFRPIEASSLMERWLAKRPLPPYQKNAVLLQ